MKTRMQDVLGMAIVDANGGYVVKRWRCMMSKRTPAEEIRIPLDYAPRMRERDARRERWSTRLTFVMMGVLMWSVFLLSGIGVYISRVDGLECGWVFLALAVGSLCLFVGSYVSSARVRQLLRSEV